MIVIDEEYAEAIVYKHVVKGDVTTCLVKVSFCDAQFYVSGITVRPSAKRPEELWVQLPHFSIRGAWVWPLEMSKSSELWQLVESLALKAAQDYLAKPEESIDDVIDKPITLDDVPW